MLKLTRIPETQNRLQETQIRLQVAKIWIINGVYFGPIFRQNKTQETDAKLPAYAQVYIGLTVVEVSVAFLVSIVVYFLVKYQFFCIKMQL